MASYGTLLILFVICGVIAASMFILASVLGPKAPNRLKAEPFECGNIAQVPFNQRVSVRYYIVALLFILFDMEAVFLFPWAVIFRELGWVGFYSMLTFIIILGVGLIYVWKKGALDWE